MSARPWFLAFAATIAAVAACGARSDLPADLPPPDTIDAGPDVVDADAGPDVEDAPVDAPPPICSDAGVTYIYVVSEQNTLYSYYPPTGGFTYIGTIDCPAAPDDTPFSMAVDRGGTAYVVFMSGELFEVSTATASCKATDFLAGQHGFGAFGMGFSSDTADPGETLFIAGFAGSNTGYETLATIDLKTMELTPIGPFLPPLGRTELTGTGDGRLFGFSIDEPGPGGHISEIDKTTAVLLSHVPVAAGNSSSAFAYAFWGGSFYIFTADTGAETTVTRYDPQTGATAVVGTHPDTIVGAGVSTCAPH